MYQEIERQVSLRTGADPQRQFQQETPSSQLQAMQAEAQRMEMSWENARQNLEGMKLIVSNSKYA